MPITARSPPSAIPTARWLLRVLALGADADLASVDLDPFGALVARPPRVQRVGDHVPHARADPLVAEDQLTAEHIVDLQSAVAVRLDPFARLGLLVEHRQLR